MLPQVMQANDAPTQEQVQDPQPNDQVATQDSTPNTNDASHDQPQGQDQPSTSRDEVEHQ